jgi:hypothetical protein
MPPRLSLLVGCLLVTIACAPKPPAAYANVTPTARTRFAPIVRDGVPRRALLVSELTFGLERLDPARPGQHVRAPNVEKIRRELIAKGLEASVRELEGRRHCP